MGDVNNKLGKQMAEWVSKNMTNNTSEVLASNLYKGINKIFCAPFDIAMGLIDIIQNKKYSRFIVGVWSVLGSSVLVGSLALYLLNNSYPFNAWGLGVCIASLIVIWIAKHPRKFDVNTELSKLIEEELSSLNNVPSYSNEIENDLSGLLGDNDEEEEDLLDDEEEEDLLDIDDDDDEEEEDLLDIDDDDISINLDDTLEDGVLNMDFDVEEFLKKAKNLDNSLDNDLMDYLDDDSNATY